MIAAAKNPSCRVSNRIDISNRLWSRERETERQRERERDRETEKKNDRDTEKEGDCTWRLRAAAKKLS